MARTNFKSVDEYVAAQPEAVRPILQRVRAGIRKAVPQAEEIISYRIPGYKLHGRPLIYFAGWKKHYSLYPATDSLLAVFKNELALYEVNYRTIRFPFTVRVPVKLIQRIAKFRALEIARGERNSSLTTKKYRAKKRRTLGTRKMSA